MAIYRFDTDGACDDGWKPASEPPGSMRDVVVQLHSGKTGVGYFTTHWYVYQVDTGSIRSTDVSLWHELPEPVWQGPGWYKDNGNDVVFLIRGDRSVSPFRTIDGDWYSEEELTRRIRLATDEELRHVCTHGTEPDSRPE